MALYKYVGEAGRTWPAVPVTPDPGDVVEWGDAVPDVLSWEPVKTAKKVRPSDNAEPAAEAGPADETPATPATDPGQE